MATIIAGIVLIGFYMNLTDEVEKNKTVPQTIKFNHTDNVTEIKFKALEYPESDYIKYVENT